MKLPSSLKIFRKSGFWAITTFMIKKIFKIECHFFYQIQVSNLINRMPVVESNYSFTCITKNNYSEIADEQLEQQLNLNAGTSLSKRLSRGEYAFLMFYNNELACQLFMSNKIISIDSPISLTLEYGADSWFLSFLFTQRKYRNMGLAKKLISYACYELNKQGFNRCLTHIRSTNLSSINAFEKAGWEKIASLYTIPAKTKVLSFSSLNKENIRAHINA
jgi:GNAT superfamily N-acetyltransferase